MYLKGRREAIVIVAKKPKVKCPGCEERFYREDEEFTHVGNRYWHTSCYEKQQSEKDKAEKDLRLLEKYICNLFELEFVSPRIRRQINTMVSTYNFTHSGILGTLKYWFEIKDESLKKANGGIGIVPYVYNDAAEYFQMLERSHFVNKDVDEIERNIINVTIPVPKKKTREVKEVDLSFLEESD